MTTEPANQRSESAARHLAPGVYVLGMHRSGTSALAGVMEHLSLTGGDRASMVAADHFNGDGYWEQRPLVEWHDKVLALFGGWASAPAPEADHARVRAVVEEVRESGEQLMRGLYNSPWFMKDPRQCLALPIWSGLLGMEDLSVVVFRDPGGVMRSLARRNTYPPALSVALWERYCHSLLSGLEGRPCIVVRYDEITSEPTRWVEKLARAIDHHIPGSDALNPQRMANAVKLIRPRPAPGDTPDENDFLNANQRELANFVRGFSGYFDRFAITGNIPPLSAEGTDVIEKRRRRLNRIRPLTQSSSLMRSRLDRIPAMLRSRGRRRA